MIDITLTIDENGSPYLQVKHMDKSNALDQKLLDIFIKKSKANGLKICGISGYLEIGKPETSCEIYKIYPL